MSGWGRARITHLPSQQEGRPSVGSHASTWAQLVKCTRVEGITLQRIHFPVLTPSRGCKQERGQGQPVDCRSFTCIGRVNEGVKARANVLATSLPAFQLRPCLELWWVGKHLASPRAPETRNALGTVSGSHRLILASGERIHRCGSTSPPGCCLTLAMSTSPG